ncbi:carbohydrate ABC transporter membrane protein 2 (CUT1 family) [Prauserella shujinwangii]|uniref:Carbohydrate ABC transporter membrane protein 2 (CUT1 family) n=1 Tax=Prauserella shujinwangii TaxID=1453103 RepID=A0A2T0M1E0_9PSEU|nr:carbohydrate ABC transporter permease [Prauserella shujinwangii]PRX50419.1 carbohydrate ABC transporter membrane protein 2 (CUT1 family) [Prauserella shujinwangii]
MTIDVRDPVRPAPMLPPVDVAPLRRARLRATGVQAACVAVSLFMALPIVLIGLAAVSSRAALAEFPKPLVPSEFALDSLLSFLRATGTLPALGNSVLAGLYAVFWSLVVGAPAGYALARHAFRGKDAYQMFILLVRALPIVVLSVPLATMFLRLDVYDTVLAVTLVHTALALPTTVLITASIFVSVPADLEEAAQVFGCTRWQAARRVVVPLALPGLAASSIFTFVLSWNELLGATVVTLGHRTLPAQVLTSLAEASVAYRFAGGFALILPALLFIFVMRRYLLNLWGTTLR